MKLSSLLLFVLMMIGCSNNHKKGQHSFYYWKTTFSSDSNTTTFINKENIDHFYIHYFDVTWSNYYDMPIPVAEISGFSHGEPFTKNHYSPVIFITNTCFQKIKMPWIDSLAIKVVNRIRFITEHIEKANRENPHFNKDSIPQDKIDEIQIDCDWTAATKEKYFNFLLSLKKLCPGKKISATIRLYPYKYPNLMGVPPVDKGLLMCYNITDIKDENNPNSVFNITSLKQYLDAKKYPLPLDIAMPVFGWYAWFSDGQFKNIIYPGPGDGMISNNNSFKRTGNNFTLLNDTTIGDNYIRAGDILRLEYPDAAELELASDILHDKFPGAGRVCFYFWDNDLIKKYEKTISHIYSSF